MTDIPYFLHLDKFWDMNNWIYLGHLAQSLLR